MVETEPKRPKLLFVVTNDFGELSSALYFTMGQAFDVTVALPPHLFALDGEHLPVSASPYQSVGEVLAIVDRERPDAVLLFSGYLFGVNNLFSVEALSFLVSELRGRGRRVVTSDPFLGLMSHLDESVFGDALPQKAWLTEHFGKVAETMRGIVHLYPADLQTAESHPGQSFFNEQLIITQTERAEYENRIGRSVPLRPDKKRWMFVLSMEDYGLQAGRHGRQKFDELLIRRMQETARAGRQAVLVAPKICIDSVRQGAGGIGEAILLPFCRYDLFRMLALDGEFVFYWNIFSNSVRARAANDLPVVFFDTGHIAHAIPPLHRLGLQTYYGNSPLPSFPQTQALEYPSLAVLAAAQREPLAETIAGLRRLPTPALAVERILAR